MTWWPGWNSVEAAEWWNGFYFWFGMAAIFVLGITVVMSHRYGLRKDELVAVAEGHAAQLRAAADAQSEAEAAQMRQQLAEAEAGARNPTQYAAQRALSPEQQQVLIKTLSPFRGQKIQTVSCVGDPDGDRYRQDFEAVLRAAGWSLDTRNGGAQAVMTPAPAGVQVTMNEGEAQTGRAPPAVKTFVVALHVLGITQSNTVFTSKEVPAGEIMLVVGTKAASESQ